MTNTHTLSTCPTFTQIVTASDNAERQRCTQAARDARPALPSTVERDMSAIEIVVRWGDNVLAVEHLDPPRSFYLGEADGCDFTVGADVLGAARMPLIEVSNGCVVEAIIPAGARASLAVADDEPSLLETAAAAARKVALQPAHRIRIAIGDLSFDIRGVESVTRARAAFRLSRRGVLGTILSAAVHIGLLVATAGFVPPMGFEDDAIVTDEQHYMMKQYLDAAAEIERESMAGQEDSDGLDGGEDADGSDAASDPIGGRSSYAGGPLATGPQGSPPPAPMTAQEALEDARNFGFVEMLRAHENGNIPVFGATLSDDPSSPYASPDGNSLWSDADPFTRTMMLDLSDPNGEGSASPHSWYRYRLSDLGPNNGTRPDGRFDNGRLRRQKLTHVAVAPNVRQDPPTVSSNAVPAAVIQRIVRANYGRFRACYESGLQRNPSLEGRVVVNFVISRDGTVLGTNGGGSSLPDTGVVSCIAGSFRSLTFPAPETGIVTVSYGLSLMPISS